MRKCIDLANQPGFQNIHSPEMQQAIDRGLSQAQDRGLKGFSGTRVVDWGYDPEEVMKTPPRIKDKSTKPKRKRKDFARTKDESDIANEVRRAMFDVEEVDNPKGITVEQLIRTSNFKGMSILSRALKSNPLNLIKWHGNKKTGSFFGVRSLANKYDTTMSLERGREVSTSVTIRHELGHYLAHVLGVYHTPLDNRSAGFDLSDLHSDFKAAFEYEIKRLKLDTRKGRKEYIDNYLEESLLPAKKLVGKNLLKVKDYMDILNAAGGTTDIIDAMTGGSWSLRGYGGGHSVRYYSLKNANLHGNPRLHETFANLFEAWSSKDTSSWERLQEMFPMLTEVFDTMMIEQSGIIDSQLNKES
jgi:hypothetical protein